MRGALFSAAMMITSMRIIPADAGSTRRPGTFGSIRRDHPRGCGEHHLQSSHIAYELGSSPRMRGALMDRYMPKDKMRIIPADAGSTWPGSST